MNDEFPTLEAVAGLALVAALVRTWLVASQLSGLDDRADAIAGALRAGDRTRARELSAKAEPAALAHVAHALIDALDAGSDDGAELERSVEQAHRRVVRRSLRASASGGFTGLILFGLLLFALVSRVTAGTDAPSSLFEILVAAGAVVLLAGIALNQRLAALTRRAGRRMLDAALTRRAEPVS